MLHGGCEEYSVSSLCKQWLLVEQKLYKMLKEITDATIKMSKQQGIIRDD